MTESEYRTAAEQVIRLAACAVRGDVPDIRQIEGLDPDQLYEAADFHRLAAAVGMALESAGCRNTRFQKAVAEAQRRTLLLDRDRKSILARLESAGIWYLPLKGIILKDYYPRFGMREMSDNDILIDASRAEDIRDIMTELGFSVESFEKGAHDVYYRPPVSNFEMHRILFYHTYHKKLEEYYRDVTGRMRKDVGNRFGYHFRDEDFYLHIIAHEYKHFSVNGTGLRSLLDTYVFLRRFESAGPDDLAVEEARESGQAGFARVEAQEGMAGQSDSDGAKAQGNSSGSALDWDYICREAEKIGIAEFEKNNRILAQRLFEGETLDEPQAAMLEQILFDGVYGSKLRRIGRQIDQKGKLGYLVSRLYLPYDIMLDQFPVLQKAPFLYPVFWVYRFIRGLRHSRKKLRMEFGALMSREDSGKKIP